MSDAPSNFYSGLGASVAAAICGLDANKSPYRLWEEFTNPESREDLSDNEAVEAGVMLEPAIASWAAKKWGIAIDYKPGLLLKHPKIPYMQCHPDAMVVGEKAGMEVKNRGFQVMRLYRDLEEFADASDRAQATEVLQCHASMLVTGSTHWYLAVTVAGQKLLRFRIERDEEIGEMLEQKYERFWDYVQRREPPPPINLSDCSKLWPSHRPDSVIEATPEIVEVVGKRKAVKAQMKSLKEENDFLELRIKTFMKDAEELRDGKTKLLTLKEQKRDGYIVAPTSFRVMR